MGRKGRKIWNKNPRIESSDPRPEEERTPRVKVNKFAFIISYSGFGYFGLQRNPPFETIEEEILKALLATELISQEDYEKPSRLYFQRAARTDKGVSAAIQVLSIRLPSIAEEKIPQLNESLPPAIRVVGIIKTTKYFDAKNFCEGRTYSYMLPTFSLAGPDMITQESFKVPVDVMTKFNDVLSLYKGTHNFHNFTSQKAATDASAQRYIVSIECSEPFMKGDLEVAIVRVKGQSFMLHQIRKMMGMAIAVMRGFATEDHIKRSFGPDKMDVPRAPGLGLMLEDVHYGKYNHRFGGDGDHEPIVYSRWMDQVNDFKSNVIYPKMTQIEMEEKSMMSWLSSLPNHQYECRVNEEKQYSAIGLAATRVAKERGESLEVDSDEEDKRESCIIQSQSQEDDVDDKKDEDNDGHGHEGNEHKKLKVEHEMNN